MRAALIGFPEWVRNGAAGFHKPLNACKKQRPCRTGGFGNEWGGERLQSWSMNVLMEAVAAGGGSDGENIAGKSNTPAARIRRTSATAGREGGILGVRRVRPRGSGSRLSAGGHGRVALCETRP